MATGRPGDDTQRMAEDERRARGEGLDGALVVLLEVEVTAPARAAPARRRPPRIAWRRPPLVAVPPTAFFICVSLHISVSASYHLSCFLAGTFEHNNNDNDNNIDADTKIVITTISNKTHLGPLLPEVDRGVAGKRSPVTVSWVRSTKGAP